MSSTQDKKRDSQFPVAPNRFVRIRLGATITGYTEEAIQTKIKRGVWLEKHEYIRAPDENILLDLEGINRWAVGQRQAG